MKEEAPPSVEEMTEVELYTEAERLGIETEGIPRADVVRCVEIARERQNEKVQLESPTGTHVAAADMSEAEVWATAEDLSLELEVAVSKDKYRAKTTDELRQEIARKDETVLDKAIVSKEEHERRKAEKEKKKREAEEAQKPPVPPKGEPPTQETLEEANKWGVETQRERKDGTIVQFSEATIRKEIAMAKARNHLKKAMKVIFAPPKDKT